MKYYAVKKGRLPGIYESWQECQQQTLGYSGAVFKSFLDRNAAEAFLQDCPEPTPIKEELPFAYIDGSYSKNNSCYGWGGFIEYAEQRHIVQGTGNNPAYISERNIAGELIGALQILFIGVKAGIKELKLYFDYAGIENYITGSWQAKTPLAIYYKQTFDLLQDDITIHFVKVSGHTGIEGNEIADCLAKEAAGAKLRKKDVVLLESFRQGDIHPQEHQFTERQHSKTEFSFYLSEKDTEAAAAVNAPGSADMSRSAQTRPTPYLNTQNILNIEF